MKAEPNREWSDEPTRAASGAPILAAVVVSILGALLAAMLISRYVWGVDLPTFFTSVREYNEAQATAEVTGTARPAQDARQAAPAAPREAQPGGVVSQPAEVATAAPIERVPVEGKADAAPAVLAAPEPPKPTPGGKAEPEKPAKVREGKGTP